MRRIALATAIITICAPLHAELTSLTAGYDFNDYSGTHGSRQMRFAEIKNTLDKGALVMNLSDGEREYNGDERYHSIRGRASLWYRWNGWLSTRSSITLAEDTPVFARQDVQQDVTVKVLKPLLITGGYRTARYYGGVDVDAWSAGLTWYAGPTITNWRYTWYDSHGAGDSYSHVVSLRLNDATGKGSTQVWVAWGSGAYNYDWAPERYTGTTQSVSLRRMQPLSEHWALGMTLGKQWYDMPLENYHGLNAALDLTWTF